MDEKRKQLLKYVGNLSQLASVEQMTFDDGKRRGMRVFQVKNAAGLQYDVVPDKCMDIHSLSYKGINIAWQGKTGYGSAAHAAPVLGEFGHYFAGGMLWTCGLKNTGDDYVTEAGTFQHAHGRLGITPAENVWSKAAWEGDQYVLSMGGEARDVELCGHNLCLSRTIRTTMDKAEVEITDTLTNDEPTATDYVILYHFNFGFPLISPETKFRMPDAIAPMIPRTPYAEEGKETWDVLRPPIDEEEEMCFFHHLKPDENGNCRIKVENPVLGIGVYLEFAAENLPIVTFWKSERSGEYVVGIEPGNSYIGGMDDSRKRGILGQIDGFSQKKFCLKLGFYDL